MRAILAACLLLAAAALAGCDPYPDTWRWNQKLTVEVSTPEGMRTDSAVTEVVWQERNWTGNFPGSYRGEATVVDLGKGRYLFALIGEPTRYLALRTFAPDLGDKAVITEEGFAAMAGIRGRRDVPAKYYPLLVTFDDVGRPETVKRVDPANLGASFGPGVTLERVSLEIVDHKATDGMVQKILNWMDWPRDRFLAAGNGETPLKIPGESIGRTSFRRKS